MKKFKHIVPFLLALIMVLAIPLAGCNSCNKKDKDNDDNSKVVTLQSISVDVSKAKTEYFVGDEFTSEGIVVTATFSNSEDPVILNTNEYTVDSSAFNKTQAGTYAIKVSSTYENVTKDASYNVTVNKLPDFDGLEVTFVEGTVDTFDLSATTKRVEIDTTKIIVKEINEDGSVGNAITDYTTKLFRGQEEIELTDGKAMVDAGAYAIWAEKPSDLTGFARKGFVLVYVNDTMTGFEFKAGTQTQSAGIDVISDTWTFTATYVTGATREIKAEACVFDVDTFSVGNNSTVVTYTDYDAKGNSVTKTATVSYTTTVPPAGTVLTYKYNYSAIDATGITADQTPLKQSNLKGVNAFLKLGDPTGTETEYGFAKYRNSDLGGSNVVEIKGVGFYVTFYGTGTITIGFSSSGGSNTSSVGLMDSSNKYVAATTEGLAAYSTANTYKVSGTGVTIITFTITKPGKYAIVGHVDKSDKSFNKTARIHSIEMVDNV